MYTLQQFKIIRELDRVRAIVSRAQSQNHPERVPVMHRYARDLIYANFSGNQQRELLTWLSLHKREAI